MSTSIEDLGKLMGDQMKNVFEKNKGITVELGTINPDMSLSVGSLGNAIPKGDYMLPLHLTIESLIIDSEKKKLETRNAEGHTHSINEHYHEVELPEVLRALSPGDRVLVAWVGTEPCVIDIMVSS